MMVMNGDDHLGGGGGDESGEGDGNADDSDDLVTEVEAESNSEGIRQPLSLPSRRYLCYHFFCCPNKHEG